MLAETLKIYESYVPSEDPRAMQPTVNVVEPTGFPTGRVFVVNIHHRYMVAESGSY